MAEERKNSVTNTQNFHSTEGIVDVIVANPQISESSRVAIETAEVEYVFVGLVAIAVKSLTANPSCSIILYRQRPETDEIGPMKECWNSKNVFTVAGDLRGGGSKIKCLEKPGAQDSHYYRVEVGSAGEKVLLRFQAIVLPRLPRPPRPGSPRDGPLPRPRPRVA